MKTKNNVQKAILKSAAVIISLVLISFTVNAQNFWKSLLENETFSQIAMAMVADNYESTASGKEANHPTRDLFAEYSAAEPEESLELEDWMTSEEVFNSNYNFETETETPMELENWMTTENYFNLPASESIVETESELELESWMVNDELFNPENKIYSTKTFVFKNVEEPKLKIESWMTDTRVWN